MYSDESVYGEWRHSVFFLFSVFKNSQSWKSRKKNLFKKTTFKNLNAVLLVVKNVPDLSFLGHLGYWVNVNFHREFLKILKHADPLLWRHVFDVYWLRNCEFWIFVVLDYLSEFSLPVSIKLNFKFEFSKKNGLIK